MTAFAVAKCTGTSRRPRSSRTSASSLHARLQQSSNRAREFEKDEHKDVKATVQRIHAAEFARSLPEACKGARIAHAARSPRRVFFKRPSARQPVSFAHSLRQAGAARSSTSAAESPVLAESPARPVVQSLKLSEAAKEKLDAVWADAIYATALPFSLLDHPSIRTAINNTADRRANLQARAR
jgi:hypothetical protein